MSKIPNQNKSKSFGMNTLIKNDENERNMKNTIKESLSDRGNSNQESNKFTGQTASNMDKFKNSKIVMKNVVKEESSNQEYKITTLESSIGTTHFRNTNDQSVCSCGKLRGDDMSGFNTIQISEYCTCDEGKDNSSGGNYYNRNSKSSRVNNQNIYIQDNIEYCHCDQIKEDEKKVFSNSGPENGESMPMVFTDEEIANGVYMNKKVCTCDKNRTNKNRQNFERNQINNNLKNPKNKVDDANEMEQNNQNIYEFNQRKMSQNEIINQNYMNSSDKKNITTSYNELPIQTTDYEDKEKEGKGNKKIKREINEVNIKKQINQEINTEEYDENEETQVSWSGENYTQVIERMQFLVRGSPQLSVQFLNDMIINATEKNGPIHVLLRIPDFHIIKQDGLEIISTEEDKQKMKKKETEVEKEVVRNKINLNEELCPENVDLLNISHAYSTATPSFNNLDIKAEAIFIPGIPKKEKENENEEIVQELNDNYIIENYTLSCFSSGKPFVIENHGLNIKPSERSWLGKMKLIRNNKINIDHPTKPSWNEIIQKEIASKLNVEGSEREIVESKKVSEIS